MKKLLLVLLVLISVPIFSNIYYGNLHAHTSYSDGSLYPEDAYNYAKNYVDVQAITDHAYYFTQLINGKEKAYLTKQAAERFTVPGQFVALQGFEWTAGIGHINVYESVEWISRNIDGSVEGLYKWLIAHKKLGQFNHPINMFGTFNDFIYYPEADLYMNLIEVGNGNWALSDVINSEMYGNYILALNKGWHLGATVGQDNHKPNWGSANEGRTGIISDKLAYESIMSALWKRHTFGTEDKNVRIDFSYKNYIMGDIVYNPPENVVLHFEYQDTDILRYFAIVSQSGTLVEYYPNVSNYSTDILVEIPDGYEWYFVYAQQIDSNEIVTSPIWFQIESPVYINNIRQNPLKLQAGDNVKVFFDIYNVTESATKVELRIVDNENEVLQQIILFSPYEKKAENVELTNLSEGVHTIKFLINGKVVQSYKIFVEKKIGKTVLIDVLHENDHLDYLKSLVPLFEKAGYTVLFSKRMLNEFENIDIIIIPTPKSGGFDFSKDLFPQELDALNKFNGEIVIIPGGDEKYFKIYSEKIKGKIINVEEIKSYFGLMETEFMKTNVVCIDEGHSNDYRRDKLKLLEQYLISRGLKVRYLNVLEDLNCDILVIQNGKNYSNLELENIVKFVKKGGKLIITSKSDYSNGGNTYDMNLILEHLGVKIRFNDDQVVDNVNNYGAYYKILVNNVRFYSPCSLVVEDENAEILLESNTADTEDRDGNNDALPVDKVILAVKVKVGNGEVIILGKSIFSDYDFEYNKEFIKKIFQIN
ncbi:MAG: CehA/McbA family metallohydrolase [Thermosipho sp. (in: Bacteria)]|nr:CehA/McbA family metallohydrolase [Thermosipho sp. (in: thermotogales)]